MLPKNWTTVISKNQLTAQAVLLELKRILFSAQLFFFIIVTGEVFSQKPKLPLFAYEDKYLGIRYTKEQSFAYFLTSFRPSLRNQCSISSGKFTFRFTGNCKVDTIIVTGTLPDYMIAAVKDRIYESEKFWRNCSMGTSKDGFKNWYYWNVYLEFLFGDCKTEQIDSLHESYNSIAKLFSPKTLQINPSEGALIKPLLLSGSR